MSKNINQIKFYFFISRLISWWIDAGDPGAIYYIIVYIRDAPLNSNDIVITRKTMGKYSKTVDDSLWWSDNPDKLQ